MVEAGSHPELRTGNPPAPGDLVLLEAFLNTWSGELGIEDFATITSAEAQPIITAVL